MPVRYDLGTALLMQRGHLFAWVPVFLGLGIAIFFCLRVEPSQVILALVAMAALVLALASRWVGAALAPVLWAVALTGAGLCLAGLRAHQVEAPVIGWRYYGPVEGRIVAIDRSASDALRLTLDRVVLLDLAPEKTPERVRISLHGQQGFIRPVPGLRIMATAHIAPPGGPVEPGGFDFQRHAWFQKLGGVGYTRTPVLAIAPPEGGLWLTRARMALSQRVQEALPGEAGAFAAAIMTGDRAGMGLDTLTALRVSNLAHLLAISGLHMGLLAGFVFAVFRIALAAVSYVGLRLPVKKLAAVMAMAVAAGYLALSGGNIATERAFVMVAVALMAVLFDRRVLSLRAVAVAAIIVLCLRPEALLGPGFQMSFAATTALVAIFGWLRDREVPLGPRWLRPVMAVVISSLVAGLATAPVAAAHFNQVSHYGLVANLLSVPLMGVLVMPAAVLAACLLPLGLESVALWLMGLGLRWILGVAHFISGLEGARGTVVSPDPVVLPLLILGGLWAVLWQGRARVRALGLLPAALAFLLWSHTVRPDVLIADTGALVGVMTDEGRALNKSRRGGFIALNWLENDGDGALQDVAAQRWNDALPAAYNITAIRGKKAAQALTDCAPEAWVVMNVEPPHALPCRIIHPGSLKRSGALALYRTKTGLRMVSARQITGARLWNARSLRRPR